MKNSILKNRLFAGVAIGFLVSLVLGVGIFAGLFSGLNLKFKDSLYTKNAPTEEIVIVAIDEKSTANNALGRFSQWPRSNYAIALKNIQAQSPSVVVFDLIFHTRTNSVSKQDLSQLKEDLSEERSEDGKIELYEFFMEKYANPFSDPHDQSFKDALKASDNIILGAIYVSQEIPLIKAISDFALNAEIGIVSNPVDEDGIIRRSTPYFYVDWNEEPYDDFAVKSVKMHQDVEALDLPLDEDGNMMVNFYGDAYSYKMIPFVDVYNGSIDYGTFKDKIVLIGVTSAKEMHDEFYTPRSNSIPMTGVEYRANEVQTILSGEFLRNQAPLEVFLLVLILSIATSLLLNYLSIFISTMASFSMIALYFFVAHLIYDKGVLVDMVYPFLAIVLSYLGSWVYRYFIADKGKREITSAFGHYVNEDLVDEISKNPDQVKLGGEKRVLTVFFSDIKGSTSYSEKIATEAWVAQINEYFTVMEMIIKKYKGTVDKYEGDAIMAFWNAPVLEENHMELCYMAALEMKKSLRLLHGKWGKEGKPCFEVRIGINTGESIVGNFGSEGRFDYTAMGDTVNTASRLEGSANKAYGTGLIVSTSEGILPAAIVNKFLVREVDKVLLPGKKEAVTLFEIVAQSTEAIEAQRVVVKNYSEGLSLYRARSFAAAIEKFKTIPEDPAAQVMLKRSEIFAQGQSVVGVDENMVFTIAHK